MMTLTGGIAGVIRRAEAWKEQLFFAVVIAFGISQSLLPGSDSDAASGSPFVNAFWFLTYLIAIHGIATESSNAKRLLRRSQPLIALLLLAGLSTIWSQDPAMTARRAIELVGTCAIALRFALKLTLDELIETVSIVLSLAAITSVILIVAIPSLGVSEEGWQGVFAHKNLLGDGMLVGLFSTALALGKARGLKRLLLIAAMPVLLTLFIASKAAGSYVCAIALLLIVPPMLSTRAKWLNFGSVFIFLALTSVACAIAILLTGFGIGDVLELFGKDSTLTGRVDVWRLVLDAISAKPALGYGYGVFWGPDAPAATLVYPGIFNHWEPESAHNGFLEVAIDLGLAGEIALCLFLGSYLRRAFLFFREGKSMQNVWPLCVLVSSIVFNLSEATFTTYNSAEWILLVAAFYCASAALEKPDVIAPISRPFYHPLYR